MGYIIKSDYQKQIQPSLLNQLTQDDDAIRAAAEQAAEAEVRSYLAGLYDMEREWTPVTEWSDAAPYKAGSRVYDSEQVLYHAKFPFPVFDAQAMYKRGDKVWWKDKTYECRIATTALGHETALQQRNIQSLPAVNVCPDNALIGAQYWADLGAYQIAAGAALSSDAYWRWAIAAITNC
ncbi:MAG: hypothetical protein EOP56_08160 [Sphingobacteriales bacterium]|nr:MAG: hypothetical protein EOP56_08160 [Sphingobacteriales bacterium]